MFCPECGEIIGPGPLDRRKCRTRSEPDAPDTSRHRSDESLMARFWRGRSFRN